MIVPRTSLLYLLSGLLLSLSSCSQGAPKPANLSSVKAKGSSDETALPRLDLSLIQPAADDKSATVWQQMPASPERGAICHVKFGPNSSADSLKCTTAFPLKSVLATSPTGRWFVAAVGNEIWIYDSTNMTVVHRAAIDEQDYSPSVPVQFRADDTTVAYLDGLGRLVIVDLNLDAKHDFPNPHSVRALDANSRPIFRSLRWIANDRILTYSKGSVPQIHTLAIDNSITSIPLDSAESKWIGIRLRILPGENKLLVADASGFVAEFDARTGKQLFTYRSASPAGYSKAEVQLTNTERFLVTLSDDDRLDAAVFTFNTAGASWTRQIARGFNAELSNDGQRFAFVWETLSFETGADWHSVIVNLADKTEQPIPGVFLTWSNDAWFAYEGDTVLRERNGVVFGRNLSWAPWFDPERGTNAAWFGGGANFMRIRDGEKAPLEFDIGGTTDDPQLRIKGDPR